MFKRLVILSSLCFTVSLGSVVAGSEPVVTQIHKIVATVPYEGDRNGDYKNEIVAVLDDGSCWKIHGTREEKFLNWNPGDDIHVGVRSKFYWFKREHKFQLVNHTQDQTVKVMLVNYPKHPLYIVKAETYITHTSTQSFIYFDASGRSHTSFRTVNHYAKRLILSDSSFWNIEEQMSSFLVGDAVYVGTHVRNKKGKYFLISGMESTAIHTWAEKIM